MENIINIETFVEYIVHYLKITIHVNKGTEHDEILNNCINMCNKFKQIQAMEKYDTKSEDFIRRCYKRINLILKIEPDGTAVDFRNKKNQLRIHQLNVHSSIEDNNLPEMIKHGLDNKIDILTQIPLIFIIQDTEHQELLWQYTRSLFYISDYIISKVSNPDSTDPVVVNKVNRMNLAIDKLEEILSKISEIEDSIKINKILAADKFLNIKLIKTGISEDKIYAASNQIKELFKKKGLSGNSSIEKMVDKITDKLAEIDLSSGNLFKEMFNISSDIATSMRSDIEENPDNIKTTMNTVMDIFRETVDNEDDEDETIPSNLKNTFKNIMSMFPSNEDPEKPITEKDLYNTLSILAETKGIDKDEFIKDILNEKGEINLDKISSLISNN